MMLKGIVNYIEGNFPSLFYRGKPCLVLWGVVSALLYTYTAIWNYGGLLHKLSQYIMVITFFISVWAYRHIVKSDFVFKLLLLSIAIPWLLFGINLLIDYEAALKYRSLNDLAKLFLFLPLAWWMGGSLNAARKMLAIAFLGLITAILLDANLSSNLISLLSGSRVDFGIHNAQHAALFFGVVYIFGMVFIFSHVNGSMPVSTKLILFLVCLVGVVGVFGARTRATYLGLLMCGFFLLLQIIRYKYYFEFKRPLNYQRLLATICIVAVVIGFVREITDGRFHAQQSSIASVISGDLEEIDSNGIAIRLDAWSESLDWVRQRPVTGWGLEARSDVIRQSDKFDETIKSRLGHLHNSYLELLLAFGLIGFIFTFLLWFTILSNIRKSADGELFFFSLYGSIFVFVVSVFESFLFYWSGIFVISILMAGGYSQHLAKTLYDKA